MIGVAQTSGAAENMTADELRWYKIERFLKKNDAITNADVYQLFQVSSATVNRILAKLIDKGGLIKFVLGNHGDVLFATSDVMVFLFDLL